MYFADQSLQDKLDATTIYDLLEKEIVPLYFQRDGKPYSDGWVQTMKNSMNFIAPHYTMSRVYTTRPDSLQNCWDVPYKVMG